MAVDKNIDIQDTAKQLLKVLGKTKEAYVDLIEYQDKLNNLQKESEEIESNINSLMSIGYDNLIDNKLAAEQELQNIKMQLSTKSVITKEDAKRLVNVQKQVDLLNAAFDATSDKASFDNFIKNIMREQQAKKISLGLTKQEQIEIAKKASYQNLANASMSTFSSLSGTAGNQVLNIGNGIRNAVKSAAGLPPHIAAAVIAAAVLKELIALGVERFVELQKAAEEFRLTSGLIIGQSDVFEKRARAINIQYADMGVKVGDVYKAQEGLIEEFTAYGAESMDKATEAVSLMSKNLGVATDTGSKFFGIMARVGKMSEQQAYNTTVFTTKLAMASKLPIAKIMKDVAEHSGETMSMVRGSALELIKASANALRLGVSLKTAAASAKSMLNFQDSVGNEMEASVLIGRNINFQESRRLAFMGRLAEAHEATLKSIEKSGDFTKLNMFQQEALAKAAGMTVEEITKQLQVRSTLAKMDEKQKAEWESLMKIDEERAKQKEETAVADMIHQKKMQSLTTNLNNAFQEIMINLAEMTAPLIQTFTEKILPAVKSIFNALKPIMQILSFIFETAFELVMDAFKPALDALNEMFPATEDIGGSLRSMEKILKPIIKSVLVLLNVGIIPIVFTINRIVGAFLAFKHLIDGIAKIFFGIMYGDWDGIKDGLKDLGKAIYDFVLSPFVNTWKWIKSIFVGHSPSKLALGIVSGIKSVGNMIFDFLTWPFKKAWDFIGKIFGFKNMGTMIIDTIKTIGNTIFDTLTSVFANAWEHIKGTFQQGIDFVMKLPLIGNVISWLTGDESPTNAKSSKEPTSVSTIEFDTTPITDKIDELITAHNKMMEMLQNGGIAVYLDGRKVSNAIAIASR